MLFLDSFYPRERSQIEPTATSTDPNSTIKRTASFVCLSLNDLPIPQQDPSIATISGTFVSQTPLFKTLPQRRIQRHIRRQPQQQQQNKTAITTNIDIDPSHSLSPSMLTLPNLMEIATRTSPLPNLTSSMNNIDIPIVESSNKFSYDTQIDSNGINHHRIYPTNDNILRSYSKTDTPLSRTSPNLTIKMPVVNNNNSHSKRTISQKTTNYFPQQSISSIDSVLRERSIIIGNENVHQPDAMERVNHILKQLYLPTEKHKRV